jgi:hypothetical protein
MRHIRDQQRTADADLHFYFSADRLFWRSPMGPMLDRARAERFTSDGRPVGQSREWDWLPPNGKHKPEAHMQLMGQRRGEGGGYELDSEDVIRHGSISRRIMEISRRNPRHYGVLAAYYSDRGSRWAAASQDRFDRDGKLLAKGVGPGALVAIYPLTPSGRALIQRERSLSSNLRPRLAPTSSATSSSPEEAHDVARGALEAEIDEVTRRLEKMEATRKVAEGALSAILAEIEQRKSNRLKGSTTLRDRVARAEEDVAIARAEEEELQRILSLLRHTLVNSAVPSALPSPGLPSPELRRAWQEEFKRFTSHMTTHMTEYEKALAAYDIAELRREQALVERSTVLRRLSKEGVVSPNDPRLPIVPPKSVKPARPMDLPAPQAPQARLPALYDKRTTETAELSDDDVLEVAFLLDRKSKGLSRRRILLDKARAEATAMFARASAEWLAITKKHSPPSTIPPSGTRATDVESNSRASSKATAVRADRASSPRRTNSRWDGEEVDGKDGGSVGEEDPISGTRRIGREGVAA